MSDISRRAILFQQKAQLVSALVSQVATVRQAFEYTVDLCKRKPATELLDLRGEKPRSPAAADPDQTRPPRRIAAPGLKEDLRMELDKLCRQNGIEMIQGGLRKYLAGIDVGLTMADYGIAETGTLVIDSSDEDLRLATMISEIHVALLAPATIYLSARELEAELKERLGGGANYTAFITGASRTADIERVLALGVHGPLELHILLLEDS